MRLLRITDRVHKKDIFLRGEKKKVVSDPKFFSAEKNNYSSSQVLGIKIEWNEPNKNSGCFSYHDLTTII